MTSEQVKLMLLVLLLGLSGCAGRDTDDQVRPPYKARQVWAVAPLHNESGSLQVDGARLADHLTRQLEQTDGIDMLSVNRVLAVMHALQIEVVADPIDAARLAHALDADGLIVGTITGFDPYDPPKLGLAIELYLDQLSPFYEKVFDVRRLSQAPTDKLSEPLTAHRITRPVSVVSGFYDAADPAVRHSMQEYAKHRGVQDRHELNTQLYRTSMDLYSEFVSYLVARRLLMAEIYRLQPTEATEPNS